MTIAQVQDLLIIMSMFSECISSMESQGIYQWNEHYPTHAIVEEDIKNGYGYVIKEEDLCEAYFAINEEQPIEYGQVKWGDADGKNLIIHRLAVHPDFQGRGIAGRLMEFIEAYARKNKYSSVRLDVYSANKVAQKLYLSKGYANIGEVTFPFREQPFYCMEKKL